MAWEMPDFSPRRFFIPWENHGSGGFSSHQSHPGFTRWEHHQASSMGAGTLSAELISCIMGETKNPQGEGPCLAWGWNDFAEHVIKATIDA